MTHGHYPAPPPPPPPPHLSKSSSNPKTHTHTSPSTQTNTHTHYSVYLSQKWCHIIKLLGVSARGHFKDLEQVLVSFPVHQKLKQRWHRQKLWMNEFWCFLCSLLLVRWQILFSVFVIPKHVIHKPKSKSEQFKVPCPWCWRDVRKFTLFQIYICL